MNEPSRSFAPFLDPEPTWLDELDTAITAPNLLHMGVRRMPSGEWLVVDEHRETDLRLKATLRIEHPDDTVAWLDDRCSDESAELLEAIVTDLADHHGISATPEIDRHPIDAAGLLVQEDLALVRNTAEGPVFVAGSVCFPSGWHLRHKIGRPLHGVHDYVAGYADELSARVDNVFDRLDPERPMMRRNWFIYDDPSLWQPLKPEEDERAAPSEQLVIRSERETMRRLPRTDVSVFTIRTQQAPLHCLRSRPDIAAAMLAYFDAMPDVSIVTKGLFRYTDRALAELRSYVEA